MSEEEAIYNEKEAIEYWKYIRDTQIYDGYKGQVYAVALLNLVEKQQKIIDKMAEQLTTPVHNKEWVIKYFEERCK